MSKAVLVMDMPKNCIECPIGKNMSISIETCIQCPFGRCAIEEEAETIPNWCPLKPLPEGKAAEGAEAIRSNGIRARVDEALREAFRIGYNACLEEIGGDNG